MKKADSIPPDELRLEYRREDFGPMVRGKYSARLKAASNVVVLEPEVSRVFPNAAAVNAALLGLIHLAKSAAGPSRRPTARRTGASRVG